MSSTEKVTYKVIRYEKEGDTVKVLWEGSDGSRFYETIIENGRVKW